jgi:uncharacterized protein YdhG (YjbR/CyaY superfamily)
MAKHPFHSVDDYIEAQPAELQAALRRVRVAIRKALPDADELISYNMPAYRQHGRVVIYFAGWKEHYGLYGAAASTVAAFGEELAGSEISKGTIKFPLAEPVPARLIERIAKFRAAGSAERKKSKAPARRKRPAAWSGKPPATNVSS